MTEYPHEEGASIATPAELPEVFAYSDETCRAVAEEMATTGQLSMPVVCRETGRICGQIGAAELLAGRRRAVLRESERTIAFQLQSQREGSMAEL